MYSTPVAIYLCSTLITLSQIHPPLSSQPPKLCCQYETLKVICQPRWPAVHHPSVWSGNTDPPWTRFLQLFHFSFLLSCVRKNKSWQQLSMVADQKYYSYSVIQYNTVRDKFGHCKYCRKIVSLISERYIPSGVPNPLTGDHRPLSINHQCQQVKLTPGLSWDQWPGVLDIYDVVRRDFALKALAFPWIIIILLLRLSSGWSKAFSIKSFLERKINRRRDDRTTIHKWISKFECI